MPDDKDDPLSMKPARSPAPSMTVRARRRREEAVRRLVAEIHQSSDEWIVAATVSAALEKGIDRDLHTELVQEQKDNAGRIGQVCHDHADVFLSSVAQVAALGEPTGDLADGLQDQQRQVSQHTAGPMQTAQEEWESARQSFRRASTLQVLVDACQRVATQLERARSRTEQPRVALEAIAEARHALTTPLESLVDVPTQELKTLSNLEQTPFGARASVLLPKIEEQVLMSAKRGLNRWFLSLRSGGKMAQTGRSVLRQCARAQAVGPGQLGPGGLLPSSYMWRAQTADNLLSRVDQHSKVARAVRQGYFYERDAPKEVERLENFDSGQERWIEALVTAFGFYRCWIENSELLIDPSEIVEVAKKGTGGSQHGSRHGLSGSRHGLPGSRHGLSGSRHGLRGSRHGKGRSLGFKASTNSRSQAFQEISSTLGTSSSGKPSANQRTKWCDFLTPEMLNDRLPSRKGDEQAYIGLPETIFTVRRAELAFHLLGKNEEFIQYYESNRFGETKVSEGDKKSVLSALTGDDVSLGTHRVFFAKTFPHLCASLTGFTAVEAALELGNFVDDNESHEEKATNSKKATGSAKTGPMNASNFREASERYERALMSELGAVFKSRSTRANLGEMIRSSVLLSVLRSSLKVSHPSSSTRRFDKDLLAIDQDILITVRKLAQDEQLKATSAVVGDDQKIPMLVADAMVQKDTTSRSGPGIPDPEVIGLPFGLSQMVQTPQKAEIDFQEKSRTSFNRAPMDEVYTFSHSVPDVVRSIHARVIAFAAFVISQQDMGQQFPEKKCNAAAAYLLDCLEGCVNVAAVGLKDSSNVVDEGSVEKAVQVMANISALQRCLPRLFGTIIRGMCHVGLVRADDIDATFTYAERSLKTADKACDTQVGSTYSLVYEICRNKIDSHINLALENFQWVAKSSREKPNSYCEGLVGYLKSVFASLGPMDEGSRAGLHFSCCGHVSERLVKLLSGKPGDTASFDDSGLPPLTRIDAFGVNNLHVDCEEFERFADSTGVPQLRDCFNELRVLTSFFLDKELPMLLAPENAATRRLKYPILSLDKVANILEKYIGTGLVSDVLFFVDRDSSFVSKGRQTNGRGPKD